MSNGLRFAIFLTIVSSVYFGMHFYVYRRMMSGLSLSPAACRWVMWVFIIGGCSFLLGEIIDRSLGLVIPFRLPAIWLGLIAISVFLVLVRDILLLVLYVARPSPLLTAYGVIVLLVLIGGYSLINGHRIPVVRDFDITITSLPDDMQGLRVIQLSDLHLDGQKSMETLSTVVALVNECRPDIVVITGDLVDRSWDVVSRYVPELKKISAPLGVFTIVGNHEFYTGMDTYLKFVEACGFTDLSNKVGKIGESSLQLAGVSDYAGTPYGYPPDLDGTLAQCDPEKPIIFLSHQPLNAKKAFSQGVDLMLSGHTHAGQIPPMDIIVQFVYQYPWGLYKVGDATIYTTCGTGFWGPPMRFLSRAEIPCFTLKKMPMRIPTSHAPLVNGDTSR